MRDPAAADQSIVKAATPNWMTSKLVSCFSEGQVVLCLPVVDPSSYILAEKRLYPTPGSKLARVERKREL